MEHHHSIDSSAHHHAHHHHHHADPAQMGTISIVAVVINLISVHSLRSVGISSVASVLLTGRFVGLSFKALPGILDSLLAKGYRIVPVSALLLEGDCFIDNTGCQCPR